MGLRRRVGSWCGTNPLTWSNDRAIVKGLATSPLRRQDIQRYDGSWWQLGRSGWIGYTDAAAIATLDARAASITSQQRIVARNQVLRAADAEIQASRAAPLLGQVGEG